MGVWIEILVLYTVKLYRVVAPFVGVWIEINTTNLGSDINTSLPSWECGLKFIIIRQVEVVQQRRSLRGSVD